MVAPLALEELQKLRSEGYVPLDSEVIEINQLAAAVSRECIDVVAFPRVAVVHGVHFREPTLLAHSWAIDLFRLFDDSDVITRMTALALVCVTPEAELIDLHREVDEIRDWFKAEASKRFHGLTIDQTSSALAYVIDGVSAEKFDGADPLPDDANDGGDDSAVECDWCKDLLASIVAEGVPFELAKSATRTQAFAYLLRCSRRDVAATKKAAKSKALARLLKYILNLKAKHGKDKP